jgi:photosynthetic reaction center cytochrome c subunit
LLAIGIGFALAERGSAQTAQTTRSPFAEDVFKNVQILRGIPVDEFIAKFGDSVRTYDGREAWIASADRPLLLMPLTGGNLTGARIDALLGFPLALKQAFGQWQVGATTLDDDDVLVLQGITQGQPPVNLYFAESGLLVRMLRFTDTTVGRVPTQVDFSDYREIGGVKIPFRWTTTWTDGRSTIELVDARTNVPVDSTNFRKPQPARALK